MGAGLSQISRVARSTLKVINKHLVLFYRHDYSCLKRLFDVEYAIQTTSIIIPLIRCEYNTPKNSKHAPPSALRSIKNPRHRYFHMDAS
jgi:3-polyprenyl-4-hydroxybenzoate decarboxylase